MAGAVIAATIGVASLGLPTAIFAQPEPDGPWGHGRAESERPRPSGPTGPAGATAPSGAGRSHPLRDEADAPALPRPHHVRSVRTAHRPHHSSRSRPAARDQLGQQPRQRSARASSQAHRTAQLGDLPSDLRRQRVGRICSARPPSSSSSTSPENATNTGTWGPSATGSSSTQPLSSSGRSTHSGGAVELVRTGPKVDYCLRDLVRSQPSSLSPSAPVVSRLQPEPNIQTTSLGPPSAGRTYIPTRIPNSGST